MGDMWSNMTAGVSSMTAQASAAVGMGGTGTPQKSKGASNPYENNPYISGSFMFEVKFEKFEYAMDLKTYQYY